MDSPVDLLLHSFDEAFERKSWHGTNLRGSIRGIKVSKASWRPQPSRHNIWEITLHCAYWKYAVHRRLRKLKRGTFPFKGSDWFGRPSPGFEAESRWKEDIQLLTSMHHSLRDAIAVLNSTDLNKPVDKGSTTVLTLVTGITAHDLYHAGQIQLIKRQFENRESD